MERLLKTRNGLPLNSQLRVTPTVFGTTWKETAMYLASPQKPITFSSNRFAQDQSVAPWTYCFLLPQLPVFSSDYTATQARQLSKRKISNEICGVFLGAHITYTTTLDMVYSLWQWLGQDSQARTYARPYFHQDRFQCNVFRTWGIGIPQT